MYARVHVSCASIQCAVIRGESIYCSKNIGRPWWKGKEERVKDTELLVGLLEKELGEGEAESRRKGQTVEFTRWRRHIARQGNNYATEKRGEK